MILKSTWRIVILVIMSGLLMQAPVFADDTRTRAESAVTSILFDQNADDFVTYSIRDDGYVDITFARNTPDAIYDRILGKLKGHPDIKGVLAGRGGPACASF